MPKSIFSIFATTTKKVCVVVIIKPLSITRLSSKRLPRYVFQATFNIMNSSTYMHVFLSLVLIDKSFCMQIYFAAYLGTKTIVSTYLQERESILPNMVVCVFSAGDAKMGHSLSLLKWIHLSFQFWYSNIFDIIILQYIYI